MANGRFLWRAGFVLLSLSTLFAATACKKKDADPTAEGPELSVKECNDYIKKRRACALRAASKSEQTRKLTNVEEERQGFVRDIKDPKGANMKSVCESLLRMANNSVSSVHKECPTIFY